MNIRWDADKYTSDFSFVHRYGNDVLELIDPARNCKVLDLGCGNGALSQALLERGYLVKGLDASEELLALARKSHPDIEFIQGDATDFSLEEPVEVVFSNAVFHWIDRDRQPDMLRCVYNALREKGQFVFEFGGCGNNRLIHDTLAEIFSAHKYPYNMPFYFPTIGEYAALLEGAGFQVRYAVLFDRPTELKGENGLENWIHMFVKTPFSVVENIEERETIVQQAVERLRGPLYSGGKWHADYVRLRMKAIRL